MAIRTIVTRGFGNGVFSGSIGLVVVRGFSLGEAWENVPVGSESWIDISDGAEAWINVPQGSETWTDQ